jgi:hypothetical protein
LGARPGQTEDQEAGGERGKADIIKDDAESGGDQADAE